QVGREGDEPNANHDGRVKPQLVDRQINKQCPTRHPPAKNPIAPTRSDVSPQGKKERWTGRLSSRPKTSTSSPRYKQASKQASKIATLSPETARTPVPPSQDGKGYITPTVLQKILDAQSKQFQTSLTEMKKEIHDIRDRTAHLEV
ncbi:Hypothetical predicted protein, partial [Pelobates cultripes]